MLHWRMAWRRIKPGSGPTSHISDLPLRLTSRPGSHRHRNGRPSRSATRDHRLGRAAGMALLVATLGGVSFAIVLCRLRTGGQACRFTADGSAIRPIGWRQWIHVGTRYKPIGLTSWIRN